MLAPSAPCSLVFVVRPVTEAVNVHVAIETLSNLFNNKPQCVVDPSLWFTVIDNHHQAIDGMLLTD